MTTTHVVDPAMDPLPVTSPTPMNVFVTGGTVVTGSISLAGAAVDANITGGSVAVSSGTLYATITNVQSVISVGGTVATTAVQSMSEYTLGNMVIPQSIGSEIVLATFDAMSIGFHMDVPTGATVGFFGSWDGSEWVSCTFRQMGAHGYASTTAESHEDWIGSVATFKWIKFKVLSEGSAPGLVFGKFSPHMCMIEGIEHGPEPHKIGSLVRHRNVNTLGVTNLPVWTPTAGHKICVTDVHFSVSNIATEVSFTEGSLALGAYIVDVEAKPTADNSAFFPVNFSLPYVFSGTSPLMFNNIKAAPVRGVVHGYETEV